MTPSPGNGKRYQRGLSLVELMIAMTLGLLLSAGILQILYGAQLSFRLSNAVMGLNEGGRFALELLGRDLRGAGYQGCTDPFEVTPNIIADPPPTTDFAGDAIRGYEVGTAGWNPTRPSSLPAGISPEPVAGSDVLVLMAAGDDGPNLTGNMTAENANIQITDNDEGFVARDYLMITDCTSADLFRATNVSNSAGKVTIAHANNMNTDNRLSRIYGADARVVAFRWQAYYVGDNGRTDSAGNPLFSLYRRDLTSATSEPSEELIDGVENMQVLFGERSEAGATRYVAASDATLQTDRVVSVRVGLLLASGERAASEADDRSYTIAGTTIDPAGTADAAVTHPRDNRLRRVFTTTLTLRNRRGLL